MTIPSLVLEEDIHHSFIPLFSHLPFIEALLKAHSVLGILLGAWDAGSW